MNGYETLREPDLLDADFPRPAGDDSAETPTQPPWDQNKPMSVVSTIIGRCLCNSVQFSDGAGRGLSESAQFMVLHGIQFIGLGAVTDELTPRQRVYDTLEQMTTRTERLISIGYLLDLDAAKLKDEGLNSDEYKKGTQTIPLDIWTKAYPTDNSMSRKIQHAIDNVRRKDYGAALEDLRKDYETQKANPRRGDNHLILGITAHNMGVLYVLAGRAGKAIPLFEEAVSLKKESFGTMHPEVAFSLDELAIQFFAKAKFDQSLAAFNESNKIRRKLYGTSDHLTIAMVMNNIACCNFQIGNHLSALVTLQEARDIQLRVMGSAPKADLDLLHAAITLSNLGYLKIQLKRYDEARAVFEEALLLQQSVLGDDHRHRAIRDTRRNLEFANVFHS